MGNYSEERSFPRIPTCGRSGISLTFDGKTLWASGSKSPMLFHAVSGKPNAKGVFVYSTDRQKIPFQGPIPAGRYWVQPSQLWENNWLKSALHSPAVRGGTTGLQSIRILVRKRMIEEVYSFTAGPLPGVPAALISF